MSLRELWSELQAGTQRRQDDYERDVTLAWNVARVKILSMQKEGKLELPKLADLMPKRAKRGGQSRGELLAVMRQIAAITGAPIRKRPR